jgi:HD-GYP domain-containing protein (c-di-GMP phosphodiesterase class II)
MAVVDIYDALVTDRPYREGMQLEKAVEILNQEANNGKLDKVVVSHLVEAVSEDLRVAEIQLASAS